MHGFGQLLHKGDGLVRQGGVPHLNPRGSHAVVGKLVEQDDARSRGPQHISEKPLGRGLGLVIGAHLLIEGLAPELRRQLPPERPGVDSLRGAPALDRVTGPVGEHRHGLDVRRELSPKGMPRRLTGRRSLDDPCVLGQVPQGHECVRLSPAKGCLKANDAIPRVLGAGQGPSHMGEHGGQPAGHVGLAEELLGVQVDVRSRALHHRPKVGGEHRLVQPALANVFVRRGHRVPWLEVRAHESPIPSRRSRMFFVGPPGPRALPRS